MALACYHLGCPVWSYRDWIGKLFTASSVSSDFLRQYSAVCKPETVFGWWDSAVILRARWYGEFLGFVVGGGRVVLATGFVAMPLRPAIPAFDLIPATAGPAGHGLISVFQTPLDFCAD